ncbi:polymer-forming cytoskeletal protein [Deinococcus radiodurans]|nr:polymer-forming cytoskeletal protein [Deinococcus radiodurans]
MTPELRALLHREADVDLSADEQAALDAACLDPQVQEARRSLHRAISLLTGPNPPAPRSVADAVLADLRLGKQLTAPTLAPELAHQLAAETSSEIASSATLRGVLAPPALPRSLAASVSQDIALARQLGAAPLPSVASVAPAVLSDLRAAALLQTPPPMLRPVAASLAAEIASDARTRNVLQQAPVPPPPRSLAASLAGRIAQEGQQAEAVVSAPPSLEVTPPAQVPASRSVSASHSRHAPLLLVGGLLTGLTLLTVTAAWPNLAAGALVMQTVLEHVAPVAGLGLLLLLLTSALVTWMPTPAVRRFGAGAFVLAGALSLPPLASLVNGEPGLSFGHPVEVHGPVEGNIVAIGGDVVLAPDAAVNGRVVTLLGDIKQAPGAQVSGEMSAVLGRTPGEAAEVGALPAPQGVRLATAAAFRPLLGWLGAAAWPQIFVTLTAGLLLLLFVAGTAPDLARQQRHAPMRTLALGVLLLAALLLPALALAFAGLLGPALLVLALAGLLIATGLSVSVYDLGRALACRLRLPVPDTVGAFLGISLFAGSLSWSPLAFALALVGGAWGAGTLVLQRREAEHRQVLPLT